MNKHWSNIRRLQSGTHQIVMPVPDVSEYPSEYQWLLKTGVKLSATPFVKRLRPSPSDPLPVYCSTKAELGQLHRAHSALLAHDGLVLDDGIEDVTSAHIALYYHDLNKATWPFPKLALEVDAPEGIYSCLYEACHGGKENYRAMTTSEFKSCTLADMGSIKMHVLYRAHDSENIQIMPQTWIHVPHLAQDCDKFDDEDLMYMAITGLEANNIAMKKSGKETTLPDLHAIARPIFGSMTPKPVVYDVQPQDKSQLKSFGVTLFRSMAVLLRALQRNPEWITQDNALADVAGANRLRRSLGKSQLSSIHTIKVNADTLQRIERQIPTDIRRALEDKGAYHIDGLVLVRAFERQNGTKVKAYARCADEAVRTMATEILQTEPVNYHELAEVVRAWGNRSTVARMMQSAITQVKVVRPSAAQQVTTPSEKPEP